MTDSIVIDLNQWMPEWGENRLMARSEGGDLIVDVSYDGKADTEETKTLVFRSVSFFSIGAFPGVSSLAHKYSVDFHTGCIIKSDNSDLSMEWKKYWQDSGLNRACNHYAAFWGAENRVYHVVAESVEVS